MGMMFRNFGYHVMPFGFEHVAGEFLHRCYSPSADTSLWQGETYGFMRRLPDLLVQDPGTSELALVEVKFRKDGLLYPKELTKCVAPMVIILISPDKVECFTLNEFRKGVPLGKCPDLLLHNRSDLFRLFKPRKVKQLVWELLEYANALLQVTTMPSSKDILGPLADKNWTPDSWSTQPSDNVSHPHGVSDS